MADFITTEMYERMRKQWEHAVAVNDYGAWLMGPPNWLVKERQRKGEDFLDAAVRIRKETWPNGWQGPKVAYFAGINAPETPTKLRQKPNETTTEAETTTESPTPTPETTTRAETTTESPTFVAETTTALETTTETTTRLCVVCGGSMEGRRSQAEVCSGACWTKRKRAKHG